MKKSACSNCGRDNVYACTKGISGGGYAANYLPGLGSFLVNAKLYPSICRDCGHVSFFVDEDARSKLDSSPRWERR